MFKNLIIIIVATALLASCTKAPKNEFNISGTLDTVFNGFAYLQRRAEGPLITIDSAQITGGKFSFKGVVDYPEVYYVTIPATKSSVPFFVEPAAVTININTKEINKTKIIGSKTQAEYDHYLDLLDQFNARIRESYQMYNTAEQVGDQEKSRYYDSLTNAIDTEREEFSKKYALENSKSFISPYIIYRNSWSYSMEELEKNLDSFDTTLSHSIYTGFLNDYLAILKRTSVGQTYVPFSLPDTSGTLLSVEGYIGQNYLLVDFWASWCAPCRAENPNLVALFRKYHDKGFDIFGVSFDSSRERWLGAINSDSLTWTHVSDLAGWANKAGKLYGIRLIPSNVLLDPSGVIIARNIMGEELRTKLEELFPAPVAIEK